MSERKYSQELIDLVKLSKTFKDLSSWNNTKTRFFVYGQYIKFNTNFLSNDTKIITRIWYIEHNQFDNVKCIVCDKNNVTFYKDKENDIYGPRRFCSSKCRSTHISVKEKSKKTCIEKYGKEFSFQSKNNLNKSKETKLRLYGDEHYTNSDKRTKTNIIKYGVGNVFQSEKIKKICKDTKLKLYNDEYYMNVPKQKNTSFVRYGKSHHSKTDNFRYKMSELKSDDIKTFIDKANNMYGDVFDYSESVYTSCRVKLKIRCKKHNHIFYQRPNNHLTDRNGCPKCQSQGFSKISIKWLNSIMKSDNIFIQHALNLGEYRIPDTRFKADGYCKETNTIYEFNGDVFHGNLKKFKPDDRVHPFNKDITVLESNVNSNNRENIIRDLGYNLVIIWESDYV